MAGRSVTEIRSSSTDANRAIIRQAFEAWQHGTGAIADVFAVDLLWRIEGHSVASKEYSSKQDFIDRVLSPFGARFTTSDPFRPIRIRSVYADGDTVIVLWDGRGIAVDGQPEPKHRSVTRRRARPARAVRHRGRQHGQPHH
jgi:ketosteroid isomerase-like protein